MIEPKNIIGIDPSLTGTAVILLRPDMTYERKLFSSKSAGMGVKSRIERYHGIYSSVIECMEILERCAIYLEGYSFGSKGKAILNIAEYGGLLRSALVSFCQGYNHDGPVEIPPTVVKKFATGKGNADKMAVAVSLSRRYDVQFDTADEYDAYAIARIGACIAGWCEPEKDFQREAIDVVLHGRKKTKKKSA